MKTPGGVPRKQLIVALVLAVAMGLGLVALGWFLMGWQHRTGWSRLSDGGWWAGTVTHLAGYLALSKIGFKVALGVVFGGLVLRTWLRNRGKSPAGGQTDASEPPR
jgi:hypothetical protein